MKNFLLLFFVFSFFISPRLLALDSRHCIDKAWVEQNYEKQEVMIPMRDGVKLYTAIYTPRNAPGKHPILLRRTPYECAYGSAYESTIWHGWHKYAENNYIFVFQDVRGKGKSEGDYVDIRPLLPVKHAKKAFDEATDTYDTSDWLITHVQNHNGNIGLLGNSYCGFYAIQGALCGHKAIKAVVPQAPVFSWYRGDDFHHNGVFMLRDAFSFMNHHCRKRIAVGQEAPSYSYIKTDEYTFYQDKCIQDLSNLFEGKVPFWTDMCNHPNEDAWWLERDYSQRLQGIKPAVMVVGGLWDAEDYYGACNLYRSLIKQNPGHDVRLTLGPWKHGGWNGSDNCLGNYQFGEQNLAQYYQEDIEYTFMNHYLQDASVTLPDNEKIHLFYTGENKWHFFSAWPQQEEVTFYLQERGRLSTSLPIQAQSFSQYVSDPNHPVPYMEGTQYGRPAEYMTSDQRFAARRGDVLFFKTEPLTEDMTLVGDVLAQLQVAVSTTDADFVVKLLDIYPTNYSNMHKGEPYLMDGYMLPVRMDIMRARYRDGFSEGKALEPGQVTLVPLHMQPIAHTFRKGHSIGVQIQSSWFPLADMNPQQFVDIYKCSRKDFVKSNITIYHQKNAVSKITIK